MPRLPFSQRALACVLSLTRAVAALAVTALLLGGLLTGDSFTTGTSVPVHLSGGIFSQNVCSQPAEELAKLDPRYPAACESASNVQVDSGKYRFDSNDGVGRYYLAATSKIMLGIVIFLVAGLLLEVLRSVQEGDPFDRRNAQRLSKAALYSALGFGAAVLDLIIPRLLVDDTGDFSFSIFPDITPLVFAVVFAVMAEVFRRGAAMREELESVI